MINKVKKYITCNKMISKDDKILLGLSGGLDSMVLFHIMKRLADAGTFAELYIAHIDHMLRGKESDNDRELVIQTCRENNIKCFVTKIDIQRICTEQKISTEMAAREARYNFFEKCCNENQLNSIITAHNADDQAETVLLRLIRGTTLTGLTGIKPSYSFKGLKLIRPMLDCTRTEIEQYANTNQIIWNEDASNAQDDYLRNKIRHHILPVITKELNPAFVRNINKTVGNFKTDDDFIEKEAQAVRSKAVESEYLDFNKLINLDMAIQNRVIRTWLSRHIPVNQIDSQTISKIHKLYNSNKATCQLELQNDYILKKSYNIFSISKDTKQNRSYFCQLIQKSCTINYDSKSIEIKIKKENGIIFDNTDSIGKLPAKASLQIHDNAKIVIRNILPGDRMEPLGLAGSKKLKDIFIDAKVPYEQRSKILLIEIDGIIAWIPGYRISKHFKVKDSNAPHTHIAISEITQSSQ